MRCAAQIREFWKRLATPSVCAAKWGPQVLQSEHSHSLHCSQDVAGFTYISGLQIFGMHGISLSDLLDHLRKEGEVITIGTETGVLENKRYCSCETCLQCVSHMAGLPIRECISLSLHVLSGQAVPLSRKRMLPHLRVK